MHAVSVVVTSCPIVEYYQRPDESLSSPFPASVFILATR